MSAISVAQKSTNLIERLYEWFVSFQGRDMLTERIELAALTEAGFAFTLRTCAELEDEYLELDIPASDRVARERILARLMQLDEAIELHARTSLHLKAIASEAPQALTTRYSLLVREAANVEVALHSLAAAMKYIATYDPDAEDAADIALIKSSENEATVPWDEVKRSLGL